MKKEKKTCVTCDYYISRSFDPWCVKRNGATMAKTPICEDYLVHPGLEHPDKVKWIKEEIRRGKNYVLYF